MGLRAGRRGVELTARDDERFVALAAGVVDRGVECGACLAGAVEVGRSLRDGGCGVCAACGALVEEAVDRAGEQHDSGEFADDGTDGNRDGGASGDARTSRASGRSAIARLTAPTKRPKTSVNGTMTAIDACVASVIARVETSQASAAPSSTTTPAITCVDRS